MKELVHESNWDEMERAYSQISGRKWERGHELNIDHMEAAIREVISKNSGEDAIKAFSEFRFSETMGISKQVAKWQKWWMISSQKNHKSRHMRKTQMETK